MMRPPTIRTQHDRALYRALFWGLMRNIPVAHSSEETALGLIVDENRRHLEFTITSYESGINFLKRRAIIAADVPLLLQLVRKTIESGAEVITWPVLLQSLGEPVSEENKRNLLLSVWRFISTIIRYRVGPRRGTLMLCGDSSWCEHDAWFAFEPSFLKIAECAFEDLPSGKPSAYLQRAKALAFEKRSA